MAQDRGRGHAVKAFFDFKAAFPSIIHKWIFRCLRARGIPEWLCKFFECIYWMNGAFGRSHGAKVFLFWYLSGVLQGCPGSGLLFNIAIDPFLFNFEEVIPMRQRGLVRACADDIGAVLKKLSGLVHLEKVFRKAERLSGLVLGPAKCKLVPIDVPFSDAVKDEIQNWLHQNLPCWEHFSVVPAAKYLGIYMGPKAMDFNWTLPLAKFWQEGEGH